MEMGWVAFGREHSAIIDSESFVWMKGSNIYGQLGLETPKSKLLSIWEEGESNNYSKIEQRKEPDKFTCISLLNNIVNVSCGSDFTACVDNEGHVWTFGRNTCGQLGLGNTASSGIPQMIPNFSPNIVLAHCGDQFMILLDSEGFLYSCGENSNGELGLQTTHTFRDTPTKIQLEDIKCVCVGSHHAVCWTYEGKYFVFGQNSFGQLGLGDLENRRGPVLLEHSCLEGVISLSCSAMYTMVVDVGGNLYYSGCLRHEATHQACQSFIQIPISEVIAIYPMEMGLVVTLDRKLGLIKQYNQEHSEQATFSLQILEEIEEVHSLQSGFSSMFCFDTKGDLWIFGSNFSGQLGVDNIFIASSKPILVSREKSNIYELMRRETTANALKSARK